MKRLFPLLIAPVTFLMCAAVFAAGTPVNFSGTWKMNRAKTDASPANTPKKMSMKIDQHGATKCPSGITSPMDLATTIGARITRSTVKRIATLGLDSTLRRRSNGPVIRSL